MSERVILHALLLPAGGVRSRVCTRVHSCVGEGGLEGLGGGRGSLWLEFVFDMVNMCGRELLILSYTSLLYLLLFSLFLMGGGHVCYCAYMQISPVGCACECISAHLCLPLCVFVCYLCLSVYFFV